jgi:hypothetical protein
VHGFPLVERWHGGPPKKRGYQGDNLEEFAATLGDWMRGRPQCRAFAARVRLRGGRDGLASHLRPGAHGE